MSRYDYRKEITGCLTGTFIFKPKSSGLKALQGEGTIVIRQEQFTKQNGFLGNQYYATAYGEFEPVETTIFAIQKGRFYDGGNFYDVFLKRTKDEFHLGSAIVGESLGQRAFRFEFNGKVEWDIRNKFGRVGKVFLMGTNTET